MKTLDVQARLEYARAAVAVLRALKTTKREMTYHEFSKAIGLMAEDQEWHIQYRHPLTDILNLVAATARQSGEVDSLEFQRIVHAGDEAPGQGFYKTSRIVTE